MNNGTKTTAALFGKQRTTLRDHHKKIEKIPDPEMRTAANISVRNARHQQVFSGDQELQLTKYTQHASEIYFGLCAVEVHVLAYQCTKHFNITTPHTWSDRELEGADWFTGFTKRHPCLFISTPEATSIGSAMKRHPCLSIGIPEATSIGSVMKRHPCLSIGIPEATSIGSVMKRHPCLSIKTPEATCIRRATVSNCSRDDATTVPSHTDDLA